MLLEMEKKWNFENKTQFYIKWHFAEIDIKKD